MADLIDPFGRRIEYVRLSVTDRCDLRCKYCMPQGFNDFEEPEDWLTPDEIERVIGAFGRLGTRRIRITGGEPLVRKNLPALAGRLAALPGIEDLSLSTNATRLDKHGQALFDAGVSRINVSLDTLRPERFKEITQGKLEKVINGLMAAKQAGFHPIKINMVVMKGVNDDEVEEMVEFCIEHDFTLRFIETMPVGETGRAATDQYISLQDVKARLADQYELIPGMMPGGGPARYVQVAGTDLRIGFITPISQHFCETCNRVRLSVDGTLYMCLGQEESYPLRELLRAGISDAELEQHIVKAIALKPERHEFNEKPDQVVRFMSMTGG
ncbi:GTP 3',8-cyclase MoaA [Thiohalophilus thiocyanatoxydans]|uniref:GTP 3',8-cyclase n=1 Tax=Thiohalophilus thiocyanatoxydans TaxID=381308 RepID=A0A4R8IGI9_9GAMM|nr:GTP 3',8-cyclase MoaA [Thiohalophilus thiocyanatoxydans]TDX99685.1 cyclic pyranopterin phosphate synthase [Thiohalophilus thiocyanatoxydans]